MSDDNSKVLERIEKLMAMAEQGEASPHEAAIALKRAQALMNKHGLNSTDVALNQVKEETTGMLSRNKSRIPEYLSILVSVVGNVFECRATYTQTNRGTSATYYGFGTDPVLAKYALHVLQRQLVEAREHYLGTLLKGMINANKTKAANSFAEGWIIEAGKKAGALRPFASQEKEALIQQYQDQKHGKLGEIKTGKADKVLSAFLAGVEAAKGIQLHQGVDGTGQLLLGGN
ncbi:MAG: hypothetical protein BWK73_09140 [Thiothrix lacustris]|uniref:Uncharacterized protein n=1 Tax=Thiothrix lacustris TaxID=525917 RepID=A0A1Y1QVJ2_9GAMM|nr:MAG: hypothetical protein BWK73_09140 [Thiothrix lacustris]